MNSLVERIKQEYWGGKDHCEIPEGVEMSAVFSTAEGIQKQIDALPTGIGLVFAVILEDDNYVAIKHFVAQKEH